MKLAVVIVLVVLLVLIVAGVVWLYAPDRDRTTLEAAYAPPPSTFVTAAGVRLHVRDTGPRDAPALLLLHGFGSSLHTWQAWADILSADYRVIRIDLPGFGLTGADPTGIYTDTRTLDVIEALLDALKLQRVTLVGNSMGGRFAWEFAAAHPARVEKLALISPDGFASGDIAYGKPNDVPFTLRLLPYVLPMPMLRGSLTPSYADPSRLTETVVARYRDMLLAPGVRRALVARMEQMVLEDPVPKLRQITAPTLLLWGEQDRMIPIGNAADYRAALPHSIFAPLPGLGHVPMEEAPAVALAPLLAFLAG